MTNEDFLHTLESGARRAAYKKDSRWIVDSDVKARILDIIKSSPVINMSDGFCDKEILKPRKFYVSNSVRMVPGGSSVRSGAHIASGVIIMPPSFINIGAYVDASTMIDSHVLVGSCAQIGKHVHLSAGVQIGGVLEPVGAQPVIIEDNCFIGAGVIITEGILVQEGAVLAPGVCLSAGVPIYDIINKNIIKGIVPKNAVVISGTRPVSNNSWAQEQGLNMGCALIIKYRDDKTSTALMLESALR